MFVDKPAKAKNGVAAVKSDRPVTLLSLAVYASVLTSFAPSTHADAPIGRYLVMDVSGTPAVKDTVTGLIWMRNELPSSANWENAKAACSAFPTGWRLPNVLELSTLRDETRTTAPRIDPVFEGFKVGTFAAAVPAWSSTLTTNPLKAWYVEFGIGEVEYIETTNPGTPRCVRDK